MSKFDLAIYESLIDEEKVSQLKNVLSKYPFLDDIAERNVYSELLMDTFLFEKPLTSIELERIPPNMITTFIANLEQFFFVVKDFEVSDFFYTLIGVILHE